MPDLNEHEAIQPSGQEDPAERLRQLTQQVSNKGEAFDAIPAHHGDRETLIRDIGKCPVAREIILELGQEEGAAAANRMLDAREAAKSEPDAYAQFLAEQRKEQAEKGKQEARTVKPDTTKTPNPETMSANPESTEEAAVSLPSTEEAFLASAHARIQHEADAAKEILAGVHGEIETLHQSVQAPEIKLDLMSIQQRQNQLEQQAAELDKQLVLIRPFEASSQLEPELTEQPAESRVIEMPLEKQVSEPTESALPQPVMETAAIAPIESLEPAETEPPDQAYQIEAEPAPIEPAQTAYETIYYSESAAPFPAEITAEAAKASTKALTAELIDLFEVPAITETEQAQNTNVVEMTTSSISELPDEPAELPQLESLLNTSEVLLTPSPENEPLLPEIKQALQTIREIIESQDKPALTSELVEQVVELLTLLGQPEPQKILKHYAEAHTIEEFISLLETALPDLTKLIDYQQHLLQALNHALVRSNRRLAAAELLNKLLFVAGWQLAKQAA